MTEIIMAKNVNKRFGNQQILSNINLSIESGKIVGLIGPNGAGKTTLLKGILGLSPVEGELTVLGLDPHKNRVSLLEQVSFIADTAVLPGWMTVEQVINYVEDVHPRFSRKKCQDFLQNSKIKQKTLISKLSKGMVVQLHLALIMAIDSKLLVLDEPTLGLDIIYRKQFYTSLLNDYYDADKTILITTHQVEEIEEVLTDLIFIHEGKIILNESMEEVANQFVEVEVSMEHKDAAMAESPLDCRSTLGGFRMIYQGKSIEKLSNIGKVTTPDLADIFVAKIKSQVSQ
jgi:ABC-2 type transport system ATP-binding protein